MNKDELEQPKEVTDINRQKKTSRFTNLNLFFSLAAVMIVILSIVYWLHIMDFTNLWQADLVGLGVIFIVISVRLYLNPSQRSNALSRLILGIILLAAGLSFILGFNIWWGLVLIATIAVVIVVAWLMMREVEKRKVTQETLRENEIKYRHIIDNANSIIMGIDAQGKVTFINQFGLEFFGYHRQEILGQNLLGTLLRPTLTDDLNFRATTEDIAGHPEKYLHNEKEYQRKNGEKVWINWTYKPISDQKNNLKEILCIGIDRTEQKKSEDLVVQQIKEKSASEERTRLARDLHDAVSQTLFSASLMAEVLPKVWKRSEEEGLKKLEEVRQLNKGALAEMRTLLFELRPTALAEVELPESLRQLTESVVGRVKVAVSLETEGSREIPVDVKIALYRIAQEALNNIAKHSEATRAQVTLYCQPDEVSLHIIDNGHGFDTSKVGLGSFGLGNMKERANQIGASLKIESGIGEGTEITVVWRNQAKEVIYDTSQSNKNSTG